MNYEKQEIYNEGFFEWHIPSKPHYKIIADWILSNCQFDSCFEVGCGNAFLSEYLHEAGKQVICSDFSKDAVKFIHPSIVDRFILADMTEPYELTPYHKSDLVICFEVAEHIVPTGTDTLLKNITNLSRKYLLFSSDDRTQGNPAVHCNCKNSFEWADLIMKYGFTVNLEKTGKFRNEIAKATNGQVDWYSRNFMFFERI